MAEEILRMTNITKRFAGITALDRVEFSCNKGEVHILAGENGAGKSTILKILAGIHQADEGEIYFHGKKVTIKSPEHSQKMGIAMVFQELTLVGEMTVAENVYLNQKDIRELQLAKAAICAGIRLLCAQRGITPEQIGKVWLAGAFGNYMNPSSACAIGMFPEELNGRICSIGNAAGEGARMVTLNQEAYEESSRLAADTEFVELAHKEEFQEIFVKELGFPERT